MYGIFIGSFSLLFLIVFLCHFFLVTRPAILKMTGKKKTKKNKKEKPLMEIDYLCNKFKLNKSKLDYKKLMYMIPLIDSFIITLVAIIIELIPLPFIFRLIIGFILLFGLIYSLYEIYGRHLKKSEKEN